MTVVSQRAFQGSALPPSYDNNALRFQQECWILHFNNQRQSNFISHGLTLIMLDRQGWCSNGGQVESWESGVSFPIRVILFVILLNLLVVDLRKKASSCLTRKRASFTFAIIQRRFNTGVWNNLSHTFQILSSIMSDMLRLNCVQFCRESSIIRGWYYNDKLCASGVILHLLSVCALFVCSDVHCICGIYLTSTSANHPAICCNVQIPTLHQHHLWPIV